MCAHVHARVCSQGAFFVHDRSVFLNVSRPKLTLSLSERNLQGALWRGTNLEEVPASRGFAVAAAVAVVTAADAAGGQQEVQ